MLNTKIPKVFAGEGLAAAVDSMQRTWERVSVKDIRRDIFLSNLLFIGIDSEIQWEGMWVELKERYVAHEAGMETFNKQKRLQFPVFRILLIRFCVRILTFLAYCISDIYSTLQIVYLAQPTKQQFSTSEIKHSTQSVWHVPLELIGCTPLRLWMSEINFHAKKLNFQMCSSTCTCAFRCSFFSSFISVLNSASSVWSSFDMNQLFLFTTSQHVLAVLNVPVDSLRAAVTVSLRQGTLLVRCFRKTLTVRT